MGRRSTEQYLTSDEIYDEWRKWKDTGVVSDNMARQMQTIARHMLTMPQFISYPFHMKEEMEQEACVKILKNLKNMTEEKHKQFFSYWSCCCWTAFVTYLRKHYKEKNRKRRLLMDALQIAHDRNMVKPDVLRYLQQQIDLYDNKAADNIGGDGE